jgi:predicted DNA-binding ribbon-helix-helix protein
MKSVTAKRSIMIDSHKTSVSLEDPFWSGLKEIATTRKMTLAGLVSEIRAERQAGCNLSCAIRLRVLDYYSHQQRDGLVNGR